MLERMRKTVSELKHRDYLLVGISVAAVTISVVALVSQIQFRDELLVNIFAALISVVIGVATNVFYSRVRDRSHRSNVKIFISYAAEDSEVARRLATDLEKQGFKVFDPRTMIAIGEKITSTIEQQLVTSNYLVILLSSNTQKSSPSRQELKSAFESNIPVLPLRLAKDVEPLPELADVQSVIIDDSYDEAFGKLVNALSLGEKPKAAYTSN